MFTLPTNIIINYNAFCINFQRLSEKEMTWHMGLLPLDNYIKHICCILLKDSIDGEWTETSWMSQTIFINLNRLLCPVNPQYVTIHESRRQKSRQKMWYWNRTAASDLYQHSKLFSSLLHFSASNMGVHKIMEQEKEEGENKPSSLVQGHYTWSLPAWNEGPLRRA